MPFVWCIWVSKTFADSVSKIPLLTSFSFFVGTMQEVKHYVGTKLKVEGVSKIVTELNIGDWANMTKNTTNGFLGLPSNAQEAVLP